MKKDDRFLAFSFFKKCRWLRVVIALIFLLNICAPAWARDGNSGKTGAWLTLGSGALVGAVTVVSVLISPWGGFAGSVIGDLAGFAMYYYDYSDYGKTWIKIGKMEISKGSVVSMTAGIAAASVASFISGAAEATVKETTKTALEEAGKTAITNTATNVATNVATNAVTGLVTSTMTAAMKEAAKKAAEEALKKAAIEASGGLISSLVNSVVQLPVNIIKALWQFIITVFKTPIQALETLVKSLGQAVGTFFKTIYYGFLKTLQNIGSFFADPVKYIKKMFENIKTRQATANPYYRYGTEGSIDKALVQLSGDLGVGLIKLVVSEYIKQNLQAGIYRKGKGGKKIEIIGPVDETIAGMVGNMVSNYVGASVNVVVMRSLGKAFGWNIDNQGGFLDKGEVNPNMVVKVNNNTGKDVTLSEVYNATGGKIDPNKKDPYTITKSDGTTVNVTGQELIVNNPELSGADGNGGQLKAYGEGIQNLSNMSKGANVLSSDKKATIQNLSEAGATVVDGKVVGGKKFDADGNLLVSLNDGSTAKVNIKNLKSDDISNLQTYNTAIAGYVKAFGQYGALVMGDPSRSISIEVTGKDGVKWTTRVSVGELASNKDLIAADNTTDGKVSGNYEITLKTGEKVIISGDSLNTQMVGQLKTYSVMLNSSYYSQLFKMTGGLMYTLNGKDMNTQGVLRSGIEAVRNMGLAPLISTATRVALLKIMDYRTHYGNDEGRIYENLWKMAVANAGSNIFTDLVNNSNFVSKLAYGLEPGQNPFQTRGSMSLGLHMANKVVEEGVGMLSQIGWGYYCKQKDIAPSAVNELVHLAGATLGAGIIDIFRQDSGKAKVVDINGNTIYDEKGKSLYKPVSESDQSPILKSRLSLDNVGDSFVKSVVGDFKNQFIEAALDSSLFPFAIRSPGTGPNAFMNQWGVYDKFSQQISAISQGSSPIDADLMRLSSNLSYRADANFSQSLSAIISNRFLPENFRSYAFFTEYNGIADYTPDRTYKENISSDNKEKVKKRLEELKENNLLYRENEIGEENPETRAELSKQLENNRESFKEGKDKIDQAESTLNEPYHLLDTYRLSIAGVPQDQVTYGNAQKGDVILEGNSTQENGETGINSIKNKEEAVFMPRYQEGVTKLEEATVDQFGRLQNTYYYDSNGERQDKYAQHFYGAFGHQLSVTKDSTQENAVQTTQQLSAGWKSNLAEYWDKLAGEFSTAAEIKPVDLAKQLGVEITGEESSEELKTKFINYVETRLGSAETDVIGEIAGKVDLIAKNKKVLASEKIIGANFRDLIPTGKVVGKDFVVNMNSKAIKLLKEAQQDLLSGQGIKVGEEVAKAIPLSKEAGLAFVARLDETYVDKDGIVRTYGDDISKLTEDTWKKSGRTNKETLFAILYASAMFAPQADGREWKELTPKEKHNVLSGVVGWRLATAGLYDRDGVKQTLKKGNNTTNVLYMGSSADVMDLNKIQTIYVPGIITPGKEITAPGSVNKPEYDTITTQREASPNYSYSLSLYSTGSGRSPYSGPAYQLNAREVNSGAQLGNGVGKLLGVSVNEYHRIKNMKSSGITAFSDQTTLPSWSVDTSYGMDGAWIPEGSMARKYSYETDVIATEIGKAVKGNLDTKTTPESKATVAALQHTQFTDIKDIAGKNITLVSDPAEKENTLNAFYKEYKVGENNSSIGSDPVFSKLDFKGTKSTSVTDNKSYQDAVTPVPVDSPIVAPEEDFLRRMRPTDASMIADNTLKSGPNDPQSDAVDPMAGMIVGSSSTLAEPQNDKALSPLTALEPGLLAVPEVSQELMRPPEKKLEKLESKEVGLLESQAPREELMLLKAKGMENVLVKGTEKDETNQADATTFSNGLKKWKPTIGTQEEYNKWFWLRKTTNQEIIDQEGVEESQDMHNYPQGYYESDGQGGINRTTGTDELGIIEGLGSRDNGGLTSPAAMKFRQAEIDRIDAMDKAMNKGSSKRDSKSHDMFNPVSKSSGFFKNLFGNKRRETSENIEKSSSPSYFLESFELKNKLEVEPILFASNELKPGPNDPHSDAIGGGLLFNLGALTAKYSLKLAGVTNNEANGNIMSSKELELVRDKSESGDVASANIILEEVKKGNNEAVTNAARMASYYFSYPKQSKDAYAILQDPSVAKTYIDQFIGGNLGSFETIEKLDNVGNSVASQFLNNPDTFKLVKKEFKGVKLVSAIYALSSYLPAAREALKDPTLVDPYVKEIKKGNFKEFNTLFGLAAGGVAGASEILSNPATAQAMYEQFKGDKPGALVNLINLKEYNSTASSLLADPATAQVVYEQFKSGEPGIVNTLTELGKSNSTARDLLYNPDTSKFIKEQIKAGHSELIGDFITISSYNNYNYAEVLKDAVLFKSLYSTNTEESRTFLKNCALRTVLDINAMHSLTDDVRFASVVGAAPEELYHMVTLGAAEIGTSSFNGLFNRMMDGLSKDNISSAKFLESMDYSEFRTFVKLASGYGRLNDFLKTNNQSVNERLIVKFTKGIDKEKNMLSEAVTVADAFTSMKDSNILKIMQTTVKSEYNRVNKENNREATNVYGLLSGMFGDNAVVDAEWFKGMQDKYKLPDVINVSKNDLFNNQGKNIQQYFFYDDRADKIWDGHNSFKNLLNTYGAEVNWDSQGNNITITKTKQDSGWEFEVKSTYIIIKPVGSTKMEIYANLPNKVEDGRTAIKEVFGKQGLVPQMVVHRGHSTHASNTISEITSGTNVVWMGSCGGYNTVSSILEHTPRAGIVSTKGTGVMAVNDPLLKMLNEEIIKNDSISWPKFWQKAESRLGSSDKFQQYVAPHQNLGVLYIKAYNSLMQNKK